MPRIAVFMSLLMIGTGSPASDVTGLPLRGKEALRFLRTAEVVGKPKQFDALAITKPVQVTLTDGDRTLRAIFKDEDSQHVKFTFADGRALMRIKDSYKNEIAAYELNDMLKLEIVPPCVERKIKRYNGSLCLWVENSMTEAERIHQKIRPPSPSDWNDQMFTIRLFQQLIWDPDFNNVRNLVLDADFRIYKIDCSMAFRTDPKLRKEKSLTRFSRKALAGLQSLDRTELDARLAPWIDEKRLDALWQRRNRLLELAAEQVTARGEDAVLFD